MLQKVDNINFGARQISVLKKAKRSKNNLSDLQLRKLRYEMDKINNRVKANAARAWLSAENAFCGPKSIKK